MRIFILFGYRGAPTNERYLEVGEHDVPDELAAYLVENGHARFVEEPAEPAIEDEPDDDSAVIVEAKDAYDLLTLPELRELAESRDIVHKRLSKADIIALLREQDSAHA